MEQEIKNEELQNEEAKEEDKPPPFEFCTNTINISRAQTIKIKIETAMYIISSYYY